MKTFESIASVTPDGSLVATIPFLITPGKHKVVVVIDEKIAVSEPGPFKFPVDNYGSWPESLSLSREDMYGEEGR
jgi:hypothetical protein